MATKDEDDEGVGFGKPPKDKQFKKGQSGNPAGSSKGRRDRKRLSTLQEELLAELDRKISVTEGGRRRSVSRKLALAKKLIGDAFSGNPRAMAQLVKLIAELEARPTQSPPGANSRNSIPVPSQTGGETPPKGC